MAKKKTKSQSVQPAFAFNELNLEVVYQNGTDVLILTLENDEVDSLSGGVSLEEYLSEYQLHRYYYTELRRFRNKKAATQAVARMLAVKLKYGSPRDQVKKNQFDLRLNLNEPVVTFKQIFQRLGEIVTVPKGPIEVRRFTSPAWIFPRPPVFCCCCGNPMIPVASFRGDLDPLLGKQSAVVVSACRYEEGLNCDSMVEVVVQRKDRTPESSLYFEKPGTQEFFHLHLSEQTDGKEKLHFGVAVHRGLKSTSGWVQWESFKTKNAALAYINKMKRLHVEGKLRKAKNPSPAPGLYDQLFESTFLADSSGKPFEPTTGYAKRVSEGYLSHNVSCSAESPSSNNFQSGRDEVLAGGEPVGMWHRKAVSTNMKKWTFDPFVFFAHLVNVHSVSNPSKPKDFGIWIDPNCEFGRALAISKF